jgi:hypothetical protein
MLIVNACTGESRNYDVNSSWTDVLIRAAVSRAHISHKRNAIHCSSVPGNPFYTLELLGLTKKMEKSD